MFSGRIAGSAGLPLLSEGRGDRGSRVVSCSIPGHRYGIEAVLNEVLLCHLASTRHIHPVA